MPNELTTLIHDTVHVVDTVLVLAKDKGNASNVTDFYQWIAGGAVIAVAWLMVYVATTWKTSLVALKKSFETLTENVSKLAEEIHLNRADEVAQRGLDALRHENFQKSLTGLEVRVDSVEEEQTSTRKDLDKLITEHGLMHSVYSNYQLGLRKGGTTKDTKGDDHV